MDCVAVVLAVRSVAMVLVDSRDGTGGISNGKGLLYESLGICSGRPSEGTCVEELAGRIFEGEGEVVIKSSRPHEV